MKDVRTVRIQVDLNEPELIIARFAPTVANHLAHGYSEDQCRQIINVSRQQFAEILAEVPPIGANPYLKLTEDSLLLEPTGCAGCVDEVNGCGAEEAPEFVPTRHELSVIAKHWLKETLAISFIDGFCYPQIDTDKERIRRFAKRRLDRIERMLGEEAVDHIEEQVMAEFSSACDPGLWNMYLSGQEPPRDEQGIALPTE